MVATLPPMVDQGELAGSGGYQRPCSATAALRSSLTTPGCTTAQQVVGVDLEDGVHPGQVEHQAAVDRVGAAGQAGAGAARDDRHAQLRADPHGVRDLALGAGAQGDGGSADRRPLGLVVGQGRDHVGVGDQPLGGDLAPECFQKV